MKVDSVFPGAKSTVAYVPDVALMLDDVNQALMLCQLIYWLGKERKPGWIAKSQEEMQCETGLTRSRQETARKGLCKKGFIEVTKKGSCPPILSYHLYIEAIKAAWDEFSTERENAALQERKKQEQDGKINPRKVATRSAINQRIERRKKQNQVAAEEDVVLEEIVESTGRNPVVPPPYTLHRFAGNQPTINRENNRDHTRDDAREAKKDEVALRPPALRRPRQR